MNIGEKILKFRKENSLTQSEMGERIGVSDKIISKWENGESLPATELLPSVSDCLGITVDALLDRREKYEGDICKNASNYFRTVSSDKALCELQRLISYSVESIAYKHSEERGWYKAEVLEEIDKEWKELIENKDSRPQVYYDNRNMLKESVMNTDNDRLKLVAMQRYGEGGFLNVLKEYGKYLPVFKALSLDKADKMLAVLFSEDAPEHLTVEFLSENSKAGIENAQELLDTLWGVFKDNLGPIRKACIEGNYYTVYPNPANNKLQLLLSVAYFAAESWGGER